MQAILKNDYWYKWKDNEYKFIDNAKRVDSALFSTIMTETKSFFSLFEVETLNCQIEEYCLFLFANIYLYGT